jgi:hypothetical protein
MGSGGIGAWAFREKLIKRKNNRVIVPLETRKDKCFIFFELQVLVGYYSPILPLGS